MKNIAILCILAAVLCAAAIPIDSVNLEASVDPPARSSDLANQMVAMMDDNMQKLTNGFNEVKDVKNAAATSAAAAKVLFDSITTETAQRRRDMESAMDRASATSTLCQQATTAHVSATATHAAAVQTSLDTAVIDRELAVIQQLRDKLVEVAAPPPFFSHCLQSS